VLVKEKVNELLDLKHWLGLQLQAKARELEQMKGFYNLVAEMIMKGPVGPEKEDEK